MLKTSIALLVLLAVAFVSNPSPERHREHLKATVAERSPLAGALKLGHVAAWVSTYHSLGVASYTTVNERVVTYGAFGLVFVPDLGAR